MKIYIASSMFDEEDKLRIDKIAKLMRALGHTVFVPHEFKVPQENELSNAEWAKAVFDHDIEMLDQADAVYYFCEGMNGDIGAAWECGYAYAKGKKIFVEELEYTAHISLMVGQSSDTKIESYQS